MKTAPRTHFVRTTTEPRAVCGTKADDSLPLIFWDVRLWNSPYNQARLCKRCRAIVGREQAPA